jgi:hypothetical protein
MRSLIVPAMRRWEIAVLAVATVALVAWAGRDHGLGLRPGSIVVTTAPLDATVLVDGAKVGDRSPVMVETTAGSHSVSVIRDGYVREDRQVEVSVGRATSVDAPLAVAPDTGFELTSDPPGLRIWLDGAPFPRPGGWPALTDFRAVGVPPGRHVIVLQGEGFLPWRHELDVEPGTFRRIHAIPLPAGPSRSAAHR